MRKRLREASSSSESDSQEDRKKKRRSTEESSDSSSSSGSEGQRKKKDGKKSKKKKEKKEKKEKKGKKKKTKKKQKPSESDLDEASPLHDEFEVRRLVTGLLTKSRSLDTELECLFSNLDDKQHVFLDGLPDAALRKKLRHLFRALGLEEASLRYNLYWVVREDSSVGFKKAKTLASLSLRRVIRRLCREIKATLPERASLFDPVGDAAGVAEAPAVEASSPVFAACLTADVEERDSQGGAADGEETIAGWRTGAAAAASGPRRPPPDFHEPREAAERDADEEVEFCGPAPEGESAGKRGREEWMLEAPAYLKKTFATNSKLEKIMEQKRREDAEAEKMRAAMEEWNRKHRAKSLREMAESGEVEDGREMYKKWKQAMWAQNLWGKSAPEQRAIEEGKDEPNAGQPWRRFDRERDLDTRQTSREDYNKLVARASELNSRFTSTWQSSFL
uniref:DUF3752 domain-containing protein n=1 Tax=Neospora caninum (strain Liverpool) TaxID=572307 RepID=F0JB86_NEOCL|nr:hypothetical protein, conserved [Neospora caninum Liverpool]CEL71353.1 TPA: hypothetical protein, conserved [Neospora caninum Liverpool]